MPGERQLQSFFPHIINGVFIGHDYIAPTPWGPRANGMDILSLRRPSLMRGEVHSGTNTLRETNAERWKTK
ncbi:Putative peptidylarginine deiminase [Tolypocladium paradoxum]|uniref:Peptidylarginine deiminase n=1 Tax=Tolypocladium paradoxum TaxID=94208 RepID=A0A2S4KXJ7_9HYPO|nr:Putative peptidylarginine deiminase [Tolypocladium paradoxum]